MTRDKIISIILGVLVVGAMAPVAIYMKKPMQPRTPSNAMPAVKEYAMSEVAMHKDASNCWSAINGNVYDLTVWISKHPGGEKAILSICGKDGSAAFNGQHGGQTLQESTLATFKIGILKK